MTFTGPTAHPLVVKGMLVIWQEQVINRYEAAFWGRVHWAAFNPVAGLENGSEHSLIAGRDPSAFASIGIGVAHRLRLT